MGIGIGEEGRISGGINYSDAEGFGASAGFTYGVGKDTGFNLGLNWSEENGFGGSASLKISRNTKLGINAAEGGNWGMNVGYKNFNAGYQYSKQTGGTYNFDYEIGKYGKAGFNYNKDTGFGASLSYDYGFGNANLGYNFKSERFSFDNQINMQALWGYALSEAGYLTEDDLKNIKYNRDLDIDGLDKRYDPYGRYLHGSIDPCGTDRAR